MNIKEAKEVIIHAVQAYLDKDETGTYTIPPERQRPLLLMGPPGIGKTAIMEQVAQECGIARITRVRVPSVFLLSPEENTGKRNILSPNIR